jgi:hypothetical protein
MRRDYFTVDFRHDPEDGIPTLSIAYDGPSGELRDRLASAGDSEELDVAYRYQSDADTGVLSLTDRLTGEFVFEVTAPVERVHGLVNAAENGDGEYEVRVTDGDGKSLVYEKQALLVYDHDGSLLRQRSLIPGSVEL